MCKYLGALGYTHEQIEAMVEEETPDDSNEDFDARLPSTRATVSHPGNGGNQGAIEDFEIEDLDQCEMEQEAERSLHA